MNMWIWAQDMMKMIPSSTILTQYVEFTFLIQKSNFNDNTLEKIVSFILQYDEIVPEEMTTAHGGFYINCGALEFKAADTPSLVQSNNNNNNNSDEEESSESSEEDTEDVDSPKRIEKRMISSSDDDETEDITGDNSRKVIGIKISYLLYAGIIL